MHNWIENSLFELQVKYEKSIELDGDDHYEKSIVFDEISRLKNQKETIVCFYDMIHNSLNFSGHLGSGDSKIKSEILCMAQKFYAENADKMEIYFSNNEISINSSMQKLTYSEERRLKEFENIFGDVETIDRWFELLVKINNIALL